ncbi:DUF1648 domain-containing protein [Pedobacter gandavensis]|uniref:DUF1648 domain-containing protein n=1 Tax=Pedobacter gandavensis TaxID=2679963 RepID=A0ABR6EYQ6_9SPHI|nr:DUF1648 domain-containing protein [Pedobacter gandavensis]MBB2149969.1 DUF1648 domain-containing protein [Pedobacter gandavensis]
MTTTKRPVIKLELSLFDKIIEGIGFLLLTALWLCVYVQYAGLPKYIPIHFNFSGAANSFGHRSDIYSLPMVATALYILLTVVNNFPQYFNYLTPITPENAHRQYLLATRLLRYLKVLVVVIFATLISITIHY